MTPTSVLPDQESAAGRVRTPLDSSQTAVLNLPDGQHAAVIGAPGSGKTHTLVELVAHRVLRRGYSPSEVLVLVPTRTGATELRDRLALRLGVPTNGPMARSANSVAFQLAQGAETRAGRSSPTLLTGGEQDQIIAELLEGHVADGNGPAWPETLGPEVRRLRGFRTELRDVMMRAVEYGVRPDRLEALGRAGAHGSAAVPGSPEAGTAPGRSRPEWVAAAQFLRDYEEVKDQTRPGQFDSTELAQYAAAVVRAAAAGPAGADTLGSLAAVRVIVLDDAQEVTQAVLTLLAQFAARGVAIIAFGDPDISTGSFHGAHPDALGRLGSYLTEHPERPLPVQTLRLDTVYRHGETLRGLVRDVSSRIGAAAAGTQRAAGSVTPDPAGHAAVQTVVVATPADQLGVIARRLRERHVLGGIPWSQMAVIVRTGSLVPALSKGLAALEVPTQVSTAQTALRDEFAVRAFILALDVTLGRRPLDAQVAVDLLRGPLGGLDPITLRRLRAALRQVDLGQPDQRRPDADAADAMSRDPDVSDAAPEATGEPSSPESGLSAAEVLRRHDSPDELLISALTVPGYLDRIDNRTARRAAACGASLRAAAAEHAAGATIEELLWGLWTRSGLTTTWLEQAGGTGIGADEANNNLDAVVALFSAAQRYVERTPSDPPVLFLEHLVDTDVPEDTLAPRALGDAVTVSTGSGTIGRDFAVVVLAGVQENVWPDLRIRGSLLGAGDLALAAAGDAAPASGVDARTGVLHDELRMFAQAASRARTELLVTAIDNDDNQPSVFLRLLPDSDAAPLGRFPLSLRGIVGRLRQDLTGAVGALRPGSTVPPRARDQAATLARLAEEGVAGADPDQWYGLTPLSTQQRLNDPDAGDSPVRVSPSKMSSFDACPLHWLIGQIGGGTSNTAANLGTIIHEVMESGSGAGGVAGAEELWAGVEARWPELVFDADWQSEVQKVEARALTDRLASYLGDFSRAGGELLSAEGRFSLDLGSAVLSGTIDRVERLADGRAVIVDLKTGKGDPIGNAGVVDHPQLGAYQLAFHEGAIAGLDPDMQLAGARLVIVSSGTAKQNYRNPTQPAFSPEELTAFRDRVGATADKMGDRVFLAEIASHCLDPRSFGACRIHIIKQVSS